MQPYAPGDLSPEGHEAIQERLYRDARRDGLGEDAAREAASQFYLHWLARKWSRLAIPRGDHARAYYSVRAYARRSLWHGFTGGRRQSVGRRVPIGSDGRPMRMSVKAVSVAELASRDRARERASYTPDMVAAAVERIAHSPALGRKAYRLAKKLGLPGVRELVLEGLGFAAE
jgi:hypothetical protein